MINLGVISTDFILDKRPVNWQDVLWGYENKFLGWRSIIEFSEKRLLDGSDVGLEVDLVSFTKENAGEVGNILRELAGKEFSSSDEKIKEKWLYIVLSWLFETRSEIDDPLAYIEEIYADFDYPDEIVEFVRYMPVNGGYDASEHTSIENEQRLLNKWKEYLDNNA